MNALRKWLTRKAPVEVKSSTVECRSWHGVSFHLRDTTDDSGLAYCGYEPLDDRSPVTRDELRARLPLQHENFKYCSKCVNAFLATA